MNVTAGADSKAGDRQGKEVRSGVFARLARSRDRSKRRIRRGFRFTREGKGFLGVTLGVGLAAVNTGNNLLYLVLGLMLSMLLVSGVMSDLALYKVRVRRGLPLRAFAGTTCLVEITLANDKRWLPSFSLEVEDRADTERTERRCYFLKVGPRSEQSATYRRTPSRRGPLAFTEFRLRTRYPFGLIEKTRHIGAPAELLVYPALLPVDDPLSVGMPDRTEASSLRSGVGSEIAGLRDYRSNDDLRDIHWRRSASLGRMVVRERHDDRIERLAIVIDNARPVDASAAWATSFEESLSRAAFTASSALARGSSVEVHARTSRSPALPPGAAPDPIWRYLALLEPVTLESGGSMRPPPGSANVVRFGAEERS